MLAVVAIFCFLYFCIAQSNGQVPEEDSYILNFDSPIYVCPDEESQKFMDTSQIQIGRHNETCSYMTGAISFLKGMQSSTMVLVRTFTRHCCLNKHMFNLELSETRTCTICMEADETPLHLLWECGPLMHNRSIHLGKQFLGLDEIKECNPKKILQVEIIIEKEISGSFEMYASHEICNLCKELGDPESTYKEYLQHFGFPEVCPFEPNTFAVDDFVAHSKNLPINSVTVGRYQVTMNFIENPSTDCLDEKSFLACVKLDFIIEPM